MDSDSEVKPGKSDDRGRLVTMAEVSVQGTETAYVTAISLEHKTFFVQQTKYTNQSLVTHNKLIHDYCQNLCAGENSSAEHKPREVKVGDIFCTRWPRDNNWYRAFIKTCDDANRSCQLYFVDYGNYETVPYDHLVQVSPRDLATIERAPFGFHCTMKGSEKLDQAGVKHLLNCLMDEYILFKTKERLDVDHWCVEIPKLAYNTTFWVSYQFGKTKNKKLTDGELILAAKVDCA